MKPTPPEVNERNRRRVARQRLRELRAAGQTKAAVQRLSGVSERMIYFWYRGERTSQKVARAHAVLTSHAEQRAS